MNSKPIVIIDDDIEDLELLKDALKDLEVLNEVVAFDDGYAFIDYLKETENKAFFILCDINMSKINGLELKKIIYEDERLREKCVPFIFLSASKASTTIMKAYSFGVQGYFIKPPNFEDLKDRLRSIIKYWGHSQHPNS